MRKMPRIVGTTIDEVPVIPSHALMEDRELAKQHPIGAIDGLTEALDGRATSISESDGTLSLEGYDGSVLGTATVTAIRKGEGEVTLSEDGGYATAPTYIPQSGGAYTVVPADAVVTEARLAVDPQVMHTFGAETIAGDKSFTGTLTSTRPMTSAMSVQTGMAGAGADPADWRLLWSFDAPSGTTGTWRPSAVLALDKVRAGDLCVYQTDVYARDDALYTRLGKTGEGDLWSFCYALKAGTDGARTVEVWATVKQELGEDEYSESVFTMLYSSLPWTAHSSDEAGTKPVARVLEEGESYDPGDYIVVTDATPASPTGGSS